MSREADSDRAPASGAATSNGAPSPNGQGSPGGTSRRDFLKVLGVSGAGAAAAGCGPPDVGDELIPRLVQEEDQVPGRDVRFASVLASAGPEPVPIHAVTRDGRVRNLERNPSEPGPGAGVSPLALSALQDLYDPDRISSPRRGPVADGGSELGWEEAVSAAGEAVVGGTTVLVTPATPGTRDEFHAEWAEAVGAEHVRYESFGREPIREAHRLVFGRGEIPGYALERADHVVSFGADFLGTWLAPSELEDRFADARDIDAGRFAKLTFVGPRLSRTGTNADEWLPARGGTQALVALAAANVAAGGATGLDPEVAGLVSGFAPEEVADRTGVSAAEIRSLGEEMAAAEAPLALPPGVAGRGTDATDAHVAVALLNLVAGAVGETLRFGRGPVRGSGASYTEMAELADRMAAGEVSTLVVDGPNPAFTLPDASGFSEAMASVETVISLNSHPDETTVAADLVLPSHHELEAWGDVELRGGDRALRQPAMRPVWETRQAEDVLMAVASAADAGADFGADDFRGYLRDRWRELHRDRGAAGAFESWWRERLEEGGLFTGEPGGDREAPDPVDGLADWEPPGFAPASGEMSLVAYPTGQFYDGRGANRSWMQELPDPVTKVVWSSWVELHPETAAPLGLENGDVVEVSSEAGTIRAPVYVYRGVRPDAVGVPIGQGHTAYGRNAEGRGVDPRDLLAGETDARTGALAFAGTAVRVTATGETEELVVTQGSDTDEGREIAELMDREAAETAVESHEVDLTELVESAYDSDPDSPYRWGMTVDLNACTGCGACVTACYAENNLPTVGEERAARGREMSWLRVERYFEETADGGFQTVHEPMLCQHCGDAPCEPVCPVYATYHNPEGLNVQVYNRCIGTRYCSNNCPYKVRRFNWFGYEFPYPLNLQLNPDVTVREKGVMEKCTFCVQRINRAKLDAKEEGRLVRDGEVETACQVACPTDAITFGNLKDPSSRVSRTAKGARSYHVLEELNTRPAVTYLKDVTHAELARGEGGHGGGDHGGGGSHGGGESGDGGDHGAGDDSGHGD